MPTRRIRLQPAALPSTIHEIETRIFVLRGHKVMLDSDVASVYGVTTGNLNKAVTRNRSRFPDDFMFQLTRAELAALRFQIGISKSKGGRRYSPYAFTEHGAVMLASILNSPAATAASLQVVRAFVRLRAVLAVHEELRKKLGALERRYDARFKAVFKTLRQMLEPPRNRRRAIGFGVPPKAAGPTSRIRRPTNSLPSRRR